MYQNLQEKIANNYANLVNMTLKIVKYHKALTFLIMFKAWFRYISLKEHFIEIKIQEHPKFALLIIMHVLNFLFKKSINGLK